MRPQFIADTMLGKLARWMSHLGYDVVYKIHDKDADLIEEAKKTGRIIITRDTKLVKENPRISCLVHSTVLWEQLKEVLESFPIDVKKNLFSRCSHCNTRVNRVDKKLVEDRLPPLVRQTQEIIYLCPCCGKIYWHATHVEHFKKLLKQHLGIDVE